jgi:TPR repeat protein
MRPDRLDEILQAAIALRPELRREFPEVTDAELEAAHGSLGVAFFRRGEHEAALRALIREAWLLSPPAQLLLVILYERPVEGYPRHDPRILAFFREHAALGWPRSRLELGKILLYGWGVPPDPQAGKRLLEDSELPDAAMALAEFHMRREDLAEAERYYAEAARAGDPDAIYELGVFAQERGEDEVAVSHFQNTLAASPDHYPALIELARHYIWGAGVATDEAKAFEMMKHVADTAEGKPAAIAQANVGLFYLRGTGVDPSEERARVYLEKAVRSGSREAEAILGQMDP